jgi:hypothetical protein
LITSCLLFCGSCKRPPQIRGLSLPCPSPFEIGLGCALPRWVQKGCSRPLLTPRLSQYFKQIIKNTVETPGPLHCRCWRLVLPCLKELKTFGETLPLLSTTSSSRGYWVRPGHPLHWYGEWRLHQEYLHPQHRGCRRGQKLLTPVEPI